MKLLDIEWIKSPNYSHRTNDKISAIVIHDTGTYSNSIPWITDIKSQISYHYLIQNSGKIIQFVHDNFKAWHAGKSILHGIDDVNEFSIGVSLQGIGSSVAFTNPQMSSLCLLVANLIEKYKIPYNNIVGHDQVAYGRKNDPGKYFDWFDFFKMIEDLK